MQLDLNQEEVAALQTAIKGRIDGLLMEIANTDARKYREELKTEEGVLQAVFAKLGCVHAELSAETACSTHV
jgi:hypothetical protein